MTVIRILGVVAGILALAFVVALADDLQSVRQDLDRSLPQEEIARVFESYPLVFRGVTPSTSAVYRERVNGVVLIASTKAVGTGVLVSEDGDIVTNEHVVHAAHSAQRAEWVAVWFKPAPGARAVRHSFLLAKVLHRNAQHDLARIRVVEGLPATAKLIPMAKAKPAVGQDVFTIGHPKSDLWSFAKGKIAQIHQDYRWKYADGIARNATAIETEATVDPGSSGGPLLDETGAIVGIVVGATSPGQGVYFAVSVDHVRPLLQ